MFSKQAESSQISLRERRITTACCDEGGGQSPLRERRITTAGCDEEGGQSARCECVDAGPGPLRERRITAVCCDEGGGQSVQAINSEHPIILVLICLFHKSQSSSGRQSDHARLIWCNSTEDLPPPASRRSSLLNVINFLMYSAGRSAGF